MIKSIPLNKLVQSPRNVRRRAMLALADDKILARDHEVTCLVLEDSAEAAVETSLAENFWPRDTYALPCGISFRALNVLLPGNRWLTASHAGVRA